MSSTLSKKMQLSAGILSKICHVCRKVANFCPACFLNSRRRWENESQRRGKTCGLQVGQKRK